MKTHCFPFLKWKHYYAMLLFLALVCRHCGHTIFLFQVAARLAGAAEREITREGKGNRINEHNKAATPKKMTWEGSHMPPSHCLCVCVWNIILEKGTMIHPATDRRTPEDMHPLILAEKKEIIEHNTIQVGCGGVTWSIWIKHHIFIIHLHFLSTHFLFSIILHVSCSTEMLQQCV